MSAELLSLVLTLAPLQDHAPQGERPLPAWWGRAAQARLLEIVAAADPALAAALHDASQARPYTVSTLLGCSSRKGLEKERAYTLRITALQAPLADILLAAAQAGGRLATGEVIELDYIPLRLLAAEPGAQAAPEHPHPWAACATYQELSAAYLLARRAPPRRISLQFTSPTTFKSRGLHVPVPLPGLVFGSLLDRWNAFAPVAFPPEARRYAEECLALSRYQLSSRAAPLKENGLRLGGVGEAVYTSLNYDRYWMSVMAVLANFALYSGAGAGTAMGLGQCRQVRGEPPGEAAEA